VNPVRVGRHVNDFPHADFHGVDADLRALAAQAGSENFPVALRILPKKARAHLERIYAYARFVDDIGDEAPGDRRLLLDRVERDIRRLHIGSPVLPPVQALQPVIDECGVPLQPFLDLIEANRVDQVVKSYETFDDLLDYCKLSAAPIGQMVLYIAGAATERNVADSDQVCAALQVLEHCQDVREDAQMGRVYLPACELGGADVHADRTSSELRAVIRTQVERSERMLEPGRDLVRHLHGWSKVAVAGYIAGGLATADALRAGDFDVLAHQLKPSKIRTAYHALRLLARR
jgi:squalene synthase HpnC